MRDFQQRVKLAASYISGAKRTTRAFDSCFEMNDGDAVAVAIYRRTQDRPDTKLAANIYSYLSRDTVLDAAHRLQGRADLADVSREMQAASAAKWQQMRQEQQARNAASQVLQMELAL